MGSDPIDLSRKPDESSPMINLFRNTVYVRIKPDSLSVVHVESGNEHRDVPALVIEQKNGKTLVVGVGREAEAKCRQLNVTVANGFKHPRTLIADFAVAEQTLKYFLKLVLPKTLFAVSPFVVIHPQAMLEGGLTQVEIRALAELGFSVGARKVFVWEGPELSKEELHELKFFHVGGRLLHP